jgi:hypothetical protein
MVHSLHHGALTSSWCESMLLYRGRSNIYGGISRLRPLLYAAGICMDLQTPTLPIQMSGYDVKRQVPFENVSEAWSNQISPLLSLEL